LNQTNSSIRNHHNHRRTPKKHPVSASLFFREKNEGREKGWDEKPREGRIGRERA
jgi:hypothetical protein